MDDFVTWSQTIQASNSSSKNEINIEHASRLFKVKSFLPICQELMRRARPQEECENIRHNVQYYSKQQKYRKKNQSQNQLEFDGLVSDVEKTRFEVQHEISELETMVKEEEELFQEEQNLLRQFHLLSTTIDNRKTEIRNLKQNTAALSHLIPKFSKPISPQDESIKQNSAKEEVLSIVEKLKNLKLLQSESPEGQNKDYSKETDIWKMVISALEKYPPMCLLQALSSLREQDLRNLSNPHKEEEDFVSSEKGTKQEKNESIDSLLLEMSADHQIKHFSNCRKNEEVQLASKSLQNVLKNAHSLIQSKYHGDPDLMKLLQERKRSAGLKASINCANEMSKTFKKDTVEVSKLKEEAVNSQSDCMRITANVKMAVENLHELISSIEMNSEILENEFTSASEFVSNDLNIEYRTHPDMQESLTREIDALSSSSSSKDGSSHLNSTVRTPASSLDLGLPYLSSSECALEQLRLNKFNCARAEDCEKEEVELLQFMIKSLSSEDNLVHRVKEICENVEIFDRKVESEMEVILKSSETTADAATSLCSKLDQRINEWWNQPGDEIKNYLTRSD